MASLCAPGWTPRWLSWTLYSGLGFGFGVGAAAILHLLLLLATGASPRVMFAFQGVALSLLAGKFFISRAQPPAPAPPSSRWNLLPAMMLVFGLLFALSGLAASALTARHGGPDAWGNWNLRARYLAGPGESWRHALSELLVEASPGAPLLFPSYIASVWRASGSISTTLPAVTGEIFYFAILLTLLSSIAVLRGLSHGLLAGLLWIASPAMLAGTGLPEVDIALAYYMLAAIAAATLSLALGHRGAAAVAGVMASFAAFTKDEGMVFAALLLAVFFTFQTREVRQWLWLAAAAFPGLLVAGCFKAFLAPAGGALPRLADPLAWSRAVSAERIEALWEGLAGGLMNSGQRLTHPLLLLALLALLLRFSVPGQLRAGLRFGACVWAAQAAAFLIACLLHHQQGLVELRSEAGRLIVQLWPGFLLLMFLSFGKIGDSVGE